LLRFARPDLISPDESARIHALAVHVLREIGMEVRHEATLEHLRAAGHRTSGDRVFFERSVVEERVEAQRHWLAAQRSARLRPAPEPRPDDGLLHLGVSSYSLWLHDPRTDQVVPTTTENLTEMAKFMDSFAGERVSGVPPGIPTDEHPDVQPIAQYRIAALYARQGASPVDPTSARTVNHLLDMAEVMGEPIRGLPVYVPSPLRFGGESIDVVLACLDRLDHISVSSMPSTGANAPIQPHRALALAAAEVIGGMICMQALTGKPVTFYAQIFPFDLRAGAQVFGSPENLLYQMLCMDFNRFYGHETDGAPGNIHVMSKVPDAQSAADKAAIMAVGAHLGARYFGSAGTLSLDEIFSPVQLILDCEIRDWVQRAIRGLDVGDPDPSDALEEIRHGIQRGFMGLESTLEDYMLSKSGTNRGSTWYPRHFQRAAIGAWVRAGEPHLEDRMRREVFERIARHNYELDPERRREIERIYHAAAEKT
jgi:trimethylamine:corrinoid methyltransferase-like protein